MSEEMDKRMSELEKEVYDLRHELDELKRIQDLNNLYQKASPKKLFTKLAVQHEENSINTIQPITHPPNNETIVKPLFKEKTTTPKETQRSFEERIMWALPKVFMIILVLGVLWGLKLISDYGYLSDSVKIGLSYALSIGLGVTAFVMEKKQNTSPAVTVSLYGGAFMIGILSTAAGAIIYEVLTLYVALFIALIYIAYGITISYFKKNEVLTSFVAFTSLLLPYLLDYMDFNEMIIIVFVVLLFGLLQIVILKHAQRVALYISSFFSILATQIIWAFGIDIGLPSALGLFVLLGVFITSWWRLYVPTNKLKTLHEGLLFSISAVSLLFINFMTDELSYQELFILLMAVIFAGAAVLAYKRTLPRVVDILGTLALLTFLNVIIVMNLTDEATNVFVPLSAFIGFMVALRLRASLMKVTYTMVFLITAMISYFEQEVTPFWSVGHLIVLLQFIYMIVLYIYAKRPKETLNPFEIAMEKLYILEIVPLGICLYFFAYVSKLDFAYITLNGNVPYCTLLVLAFVMITSLFTPARYIGRFLPVALFGAFIIAALNILPVQYYSDDVEVLNQFTRIVYIVVILAIVADIYMQGSIYQKWKHYIAKSTDGIISAGIVLSMISLMSIISQLEYNAVFNWKVAIAGRTIILFITASVALWLSTLKSLRVLRITGFVILAFAIIKLIFFDLSTLDLLIRTILFITIGGIGLLLSNRLLKKQ